MFNWFDRLRFMAALRAEHDVATYAERLLGSHQWSLLRTFGKCMGGPPYGGLYVSGLPAGEVRRLLQALDAGKIVPIHLMHRHQSGKYESSRLQLTADRLLFMVYKDRKVQALPR